MIDVTVLLVGHAYVSTAIGPMDMFSAAGRFWNELTGERTSPAFRVRTASVGPGDVTPDGPLTVRAAQTIEQIRKTDLIFVPSAGMDVDDMLARNAALLPWLRRHHAKGTPIAAVCTGVALIAAAGLLDGRRATTHWGFAQEYMRRFDKAIWQPERVVTDDDGIYCGSGINAAFDLSLYLIEKFCGHETAVETAKSMLVDMPRVWQTGFSKEELHTHHGDETILKAQHWLHDHYAGEFTFEQVASRVGMSPRNFARRFKQATGHSPLAYLHIVRVAVAKLHLENGRTGIEEIGRTVGYQDTLFFRTIFRRHTDMSPGEYRRRIGGRAA